MKRLQLTSDNFRYLLHGFRQWLELLGYAETTFETLPVYVREFLHYLENQQNKYHISQAATQDIIQFVKYLKCRSNQKRGGGLSTSHINKSIQSVNTFTKYINQTDKYLLEAHPKYLQTYVPERTILTQKEIKQLYEATYTPHRENTLAIGQRDRVILALFYGCGLRKSEGIKLNLLDVDLINKRLFVRKGKGNKQRYVPIASKHVEDIQRYLEEGRNWFLEDNSQSYYRIKGQIKTKKNPDTEALLLNQNGKRLQSIYQRIEYLKEQSGIEKAFSTHSLRHSIATHLLESGMEIEDIAKFLGHSSLESTQIYTHLTGNEEIKK